jgi:serine/threonine protein phosphatase PrpC
VYDKLRHSRRLNVIQSGCTALSIIKQEDRMVVANIGDSRVGLGIVSNDRAINPSSSLSI